LAGRPHSRTVIATAGERGTRFADSAVYVQIVKT